MNRIELIRREEKKYHDFCYENYKLFEKGSWLSKPVKTVMDLLPLFEGKQGVRILDLGSGVGRNSVPIAQKIKSQQGTVVCVDLLSSAIEKLRHYSEEYMVDDVIQLHQADIGDYLIEEEEFDLIVAVSTLEHVASEDIFNDVLTRMRAGTKKDGVNCIIVNSEVEEIANDTGERLEALMEINVSTEEMKEKLATCYEGWAVLKQTVRPQTYTIVRNGREIKLTTNVITFVVRRS